MLRQSEILNNKLFHIHSFITVFKNIQKSLTGETLLVDSKHIKRGLKCLVNDWQYVTQK